MAEAASPAGKAAVIGTGLIGRAWAIVFARAGWETRLYDPGAGAAQAALARIAESLGDLEDAGLIRSAAEVMARMAPAESLAAALDGVEFAQESAPENVDIKRAVFRDMDGLAPLGAILASSCSAIPGSRFLDVAGRHRCLIAHPVSPPHLVPLVELVPSPWTDAETVERCQRLMAGLGQVPVIVRREVPGFVLNRLQAAVVNEAIQLVAAGVISPDDLDKTMRHGLGLRWSFMGPFETMDLNADGGFAEYAAKYGESYRMLGKDLKAAEPWPDEAVEQIAAACRKLVPADAVKARQAWRDRRLMALIKHQRAAEQLDR